jgi:uncharacterized SAM-binding protein YcdF (DUF218 family)
MTAGRRIAGSGVVIVATLALLWGAGFAWFLRAALTEAPPPPLADGIVAFTGGAERVETALRLLADGRARLLLVSGVGGAAEFAELARRAGVDRNLAGRVTLGRAAASTRGNAAETADWARDHAIHSLIVVTAGYHMPRALAELARALPKVTLHPAPVLPPALRDGGVPLVRLLAGEYTKFLAAELGLTALDPRGPIPANGRALTERHG